MITSNNLLTCFSKLSETEIKTFMASAQLEIQQIFDDERFPNVVVTPYGTVLASWGSPNIRVRRSEDGGITWSEEITIVKSGFHGGGTTINETNAEFNAEGDDEERSCWWGELIEWLLSK